ncbi:glycosyltransferase family A protein [Microcoleus sp. AR_TQ3_B6]
MPSHNRSSSLRRGLDALHSQTYSLDPIEVIVVADSCINDTLAILQDYKAPFKQQAIDVNCRSAAIARNTGAASAIGQLLLFLDDDIEALPPLVESHAQVYRERPGSAVMDPDRVFVADGCGWAGCVREEIPGFARKLGMRVSWRWLRAKLRGYWSLRGVIDELQSRSAISSFMKGGPVPADLGYRENVRQAGEITNKVACIGVILS